MLTLATAIGSLQVGGQTWTLDDEGYAYADGVPAKYWQGSRLTACDQVPYLLGTDGQWHKWVGADWVTVGALPTEMVIPSAPSVLAWKDGWWTLGASGEVLRHGEHMGGGYGVEIHATDTLIYVRGTDGEWWQWGVGWVASPGPDGSPVAPEPDGAPATAADAFLKSIGVTTHLNYLDTAYYTHWPVIRDLLIDSGITHVREGIPRMDPWYYERVTEWHKAGIRFLALLGKATGAELDALIAAMPNIDAIEGLNEWDLNGGENWAADLRTYQKEFYQLADAYHLIVLGPSLTSQAAFEAVGELDAWMDLAQLHNYYGTRNPETPGWGDDGYGSLDWSKRQSAKIAPGVGIWTVETGYPTAPGYDPRMAHDMPEAACVRYLTRLLCEQFAQGLERTYLYQFVDDFTSDGTIDSYATHGLVRSDGTPKATYHAVKNLIGRIRALGDDYDDRTLAYTLSDVPDLRRLLLSTADHSFVLLLWLGIESMHPDTLALYDAVERPVTLTLPASHRVLGINRMGDDGQWSNVELSASDRLTLVQIGPV